MYPVWGLLQADHFQASRDFSFGDQFAGSCAGTHLTGSFPIPRRLHVAVPKGPRPALSRAHGINRAARCAIVEDTVAVGLLAQAAVTARPAGVQGNDLFDRFAAVFGDGSDFGIVDPDETRRAGAAVAAAGAAKTQAVLVPPFRHEFRQP